MKIRITDISYRHREVEVPTTCPHCTAGLVPTPEDDGFGPTFGVLTGEAHVGALTVEDARGLVQPELHVLDDVFKPDEMAGSLIVYIACGNPHCARILIEGEVTPG
jgi:hypothetical protein